ncbi:MAG: S8 family serine peptidase [Armatimonadetes bacterium]|nr:S8 family serine peptidase [Armatimonadota bacterium]
MLKTTIILVAAFVAVQGYAQERSWQIENRFTKSASKGALSNTETQFLIVRLRQADSRIGKSLKSSASWITVDAGSLSNLAKTRNALLRNPNVAGVYPVSNAPIQLEGFYPNDSYYVRDQPIAGLRGQWNLENTFEPGIDINVVGAWANNWTGSGVTMVNIDDACQTGHTDIFPNYVSANSWDFASGDAFPVPVSSAENHGTCVAGIMAARGGNNTGVTGVAPFGLVSTIRIGFSAANVVTQLTDGTLFKSSGANTDIKIKNHSYGTSIPYVDFSVLSAAMDTSTASGTIHVRSAGNYRGTTGEDANKSNDRATPSAITVSALGHTGVFSDYSNFGANVMCCAPSSDTASGGVGIFTTDRTGSLGYNGSGDPMPDQSYTSVFGGTSACAPQVAGVLALAKQANPNLSTRMAKHLIARTSKQVDTLDASSTGAWVTNAAGLKFNPNYGFGLIDATALVNMALANSGVTALTTTVVGTTSVAAAIPDDNPTGLERTFVVGSTTPLEEVLVTLNVTHAWRGDVSAIMTSPSGTVHKVLLENGSDSGPSINWTFAVNGFWGENPAGTWRIKLVDNFSGDTGTWNSYGVTFRQGTLVSAERTVSGTVDLLDFSTDQGQVATFELYNGATLVETKTDTLGVSGAFSFTTSQSGTFTLKASGRHWLRKAVAGVNTSADVSGLSFACANADIAHDNVIDLSDYTYLVVNFNKTSGDSDWNTPDGSGVTPADSDLNGDSVVDLSDYTVLVVNFNMTGD